MGTIGRGAASAAIAVVILTGTSRGDELCPTSPYDPPPTGGTIVNTCYPGVALDLPAGSTAIPVGRPTQGTAIQSGDLLLVMQMQDADINTDDDGNYGDGEPRGEVPAPDDPGTGFLDANATGRYEYVVALGPVEPGSSGAPDLVPIRGRGAGDGLLFSYRSEPYAPGAGGHGQRSFQVVRVARFVNLKLPSGGLACHPWNGSCGGVIAIDVTGTLDLDGQELNAAGCGFRGGLGERLGGSVLATNSDYRNTTAAEAHGNKGEGIAGTPRFVRESHTGDEVDTGVEGYPDGSRARGAPGNAGGGGTDSFPHSNNDSVGGGGGGNGSSGGKGGNGTSGNPGGGFGGSAFALAEGSALWTAGRVVMGGGGGSGTQNDAGGKGSAGGSGGGIVLLRAGSVTGTGRIDLRGDDAPYAGNDGAGGGGAGGSAILVTFAGDWSGLAVIARGGKGGDAGTGDSVLGPGGGGGGGVVLSNALVGSVDTGGGASGTTDGGLTTFGSTPGGSGTGEPGGSANPYVDPRDIPGAHSGAECATNDPPVNHLPGPQSADEDTVLVLSSAAVPPNAISISDPDAGAGPLEITLTAVNGTLTLSGTAGLSFSSGDGAADAFMVFQGSMADINVSLDGIVFTPPPGYGGPAGMTITTDDLGNTGAGGAKLDTDSLSIQIGVVNDAPFNTVPGAQATAEDSPLLFSVAGGNALGVSDPDAGAFPVRLSITVTHGTLTVGSIAGLSFTEGDGTADAAMTFTASLDDLNAALDGLIYRPDADFASPPQALLVMTSNDLGATGAGGPLSDTDSVTITVTPVNDPPTAAGDSFTTREDVLLNAHGVLDNDTDVDGDTLSAVLVSPPSHGTLTLETDGSFAYQPASNFYGSDSFSYRASDGITLSETATVSILVTPVPDVEVRHAGYCWASVSSPSQVRIPWMAAAAFILLVVPRYRRKGVRR